MLKKLTNLAIGTLMMGGGLAATSSDAQAHPYYHSYYHPYHSTSVHMCMHCSEYVVDSHDPREPHGAWLKHGPGLSYPTYKTLLNGSPVWPMRGPNTHKNGWHLMKWIEAGKEQTHWIHHSVMRCTKWY